MFDPGTEPYRRWSTRATGCSCHTFVAAGLEANRRDIIRYLWDTWSPGWQYTDEAFDRSAPSFDNPDFVDVVIHSYRHRHVNAPGEERFLAVERQPYTLNGIEVYDDVYANQYRPE